MFSPSAPGRDRKDLEERQRKRRRAGKIVSFRDLDNDVGD